MTANSPVPPAASGEGAPPAGSRPVVVIEGAPQPLTGLPLPPAMPESTQPPRAASGGQPRRSVLQLFLGSAILVTDEVSERLVVSDEELAAPPPATRESVLRPAAEWDESFTAAPPLQTATYLAVGMTQSAGEQADRLFRFAANTTARAAAAADRFLGPVWNSALGAPVRRPVLKVQQRGREQMDEWIRRGRAESASSRALAQTSLTGFVTQSVTDLSGNIQVQGMVQDVIASPEVQEMIEQIIASQSTSIVGSILEEVRERFVTIDILVERPFRRLFGRQRRETLPPPPFRDAVVARRQAVYKGRRLEGTLAGYGAGFATRLAAFVIDMLVLFLAYTVGTAFVAGTLSLFGLETIVRDFFTQSTHWQAAGASILALVTMSVVVGYGVLSWYLTGETLGDTVMGITIISPDGGRVTLGRAIRRIIGCLIAAIPFFLGFFWVLWDGERQGWHDKIGGTYAVYDWPAMTDEQFLVDQLRRPAVE